MTTEAMGGERKELPEKVPEGKVRLKNRDIVAITNALVILAQRKLPSMKVEKRYARLIRAYKPEMQEIEDLVNKRKLDHAVTDEDTGESVIRNHAGLVVAINEFYAQETDIDDLGIRLTDDDMPKDEKHDKLAENRVGLAALKADLGYLFPLDGDE